MSEGIIIALITGAFSFGASLLANSSSNKKLVNDLIAGVIVFKWK